MLSFALRQSSSMFMSLAMLVAWQRGVFAPAALFCLALSIGGVLVIVGRR